ncbi:LACTOYLGLUTATHIONE LYASE [Salix koriyanagi]|uniref:lactoylglutathione lyase n=1 Tax=Salix koriyanagi TaxID=2511006 RepID=A0A9Q1A598_9ROSI|nr:LACTOYLGLUTATHIONE LYASE [Salix koriyanagi]
MLRTVTVPSLSFSSSTHLKVSTQNTSYLAPHSLKLSSPLIGNISKSNSTRTVTCNYNPSRRLALLQLGTVIPQSQFLSGTLAPARSSEVTDQKTIKFYTECLGMKLLRRRDIPEDRYSNAFLGYGPEDTNFTVELTYNYGVDKYDIGDGFGHFGIAVEDVARTVDLVKAKGGKVTRELAPVKGGSTIIAFVEDPNGYKFELLERGLTPEPLCQVMLRVGDLDRSINFYKKSFGMELLRRRDNPEYKYTVALMGYEYNKGNGYTQIAIGTDDVYKSAEAVKLCGGKIIREPGPIPVINTKITACLDPDGWKSVFVDNVDFFKELE